MRPVRVLAFSLLGRALASTTPQSGLLPRDEAELLERGLVQDIWEDIKDGLSCVGCESLIVLLKGLALLGDGIFVDALQGVCKLANAQDDDVCEGAIALEGPIVANAIRKMRVPSQTSKLFCINFLGVCPYPAVTAHQVAFPSEKAQNLVRPPPSGKPPVKIVHYSDIHIDHLYVPGSNANCTKPICCRPYTEDDAPGVSDSPAGPNGDHNCDTPLSLAESMYSAINEVAPDAIFGICTGDIVDHAVWDTSKEYNTFSITDAYNRMAEALPLVYGTTGNHEAHPTNAFPPRSVDTSPNWVYGLLSTSWSRWIGPDASSTAALSGSYSVKYPEGNLRVISINTNMWYAHNYWLYQRDMPLDPDGQLAWLVSELDAAERAAERVYLVGHMPLGDHHAFRDQSNYLDQIVDRYGETIAAMFFGHTHLDEIQISYASYEDPRVSDPRAVSYIAPSLTPTSGHPSFKVYLVDPDTFAVLDAETWIADMTDPAFQDSPTWTKLYSARDAYGGPDLEPGAELTPSFWHSVTDALESDPDALDAYLSRKSRGWAAGDRGTTACVDDECRRREVCKLRGARAENNCYEPSPGVNFRKRSEEARGSGDDCGISVLQGAVAALALDRDAVELVQGKVREKRGLLL